MKPISIHLVIIISIIAFSPFSVKAYFPISPYSYCNNNSVNYTDPTGCVVEGASKKDAAFVVEDFRAMFPGEDFSNFRNLIIQSGKKQNGKSLATISQEALSTAFDGVSLNDDQQALVEMVVNTINSDAVHKIEYLESTGNVSYSAEKIFAPLFDNPGLPISLILNKNNGLPVALIENQGGGGITTLTDKGTYSLVFKNSSFHLNGRGCCRTPFSTILSKIQLLIISMLQKLFS